MDRIIEVKVGGNHIKKDCKSAGVRGEANVTSLRITFDSGWSEYDKKVTFWDARGLNPVAIDLVPTLLESILLSKSVYIVPIPAEPLAEAGEMTFVIDGYIDGKRQRSMADKLEVNDAPIANNASQPVEPTPTQIQQLQLSVGKLIDEIHNGVEAKEAIEGMTVSAVTLSSGEKAFVDKSDTETKDGVKTTHLKFGLPVGDSAYQIAVQNGFEGTQGEWLASLKGDKGEQGIQGKQGAKGDRGDKGEDGKDFKILGYYSSLDALNAAATTPSSGDAYGVGEDAPYDIYIYDEKSGWVNNGPIAAGIDIDLRNGTADNSLEGADSNENPAISLGEECISLGSGSVAGCMGYYIQAIDFNNRKIYLTDAKVDGLPTVGAGEVTDLNVPYVYNVTSEPVEFCIINGYHYPLCGVIKSISNNVITFEGDLGFTEFKEDSGIDGHIFYVPTQPSIGAVSFVTNATSIGINVVNTGKGAFGAGRDLLLTEGYGANIGRRNKTGYGATAIGIDNIILAQTGVGLGYRHHITKEGYAGVALGEGNYISARNASAIGLLLMACSRAQNVRGVCNIPDYDGKFIDIVGNGKSDDDRSNAYTLDWDGNATFAGKVYSENGKELLDADTADNLFEEKLIDKGLIGGGNKTYQTYGVSIDLSNSNPETAVTYTDDAVGMIPGSDYWFKTSIFKDIKPCILFNDGLVDYLDPNDFNRFEDGTSISVLGGDGNVMIEIPKMGYRISKSGTILTVQVTNDPNKEGFSYKAHTRKIEGDREKLYIGAYLGSGDTLKSYPNRTPSNNTNLADFRTKAQANGEGYDLLSYYPLLLLQCLYLIMYKNLDSQSALGTGYITKSSATVLTGGTATKGMNYGSSDQTQQIKFLGIEDFWGHLYQWIDGIMSNRDGDALVATEGFNNSGSGYTNAGKVGNIIGYMSEPQGNNDLGFITAENHGSATTYFSDYMSFSSDSSYVTVYGGCLGSGSTAGVFRMSVYESPNTASASTGARLMYL